MRNRYSQSLNPKEKGKKGKKERKKETERKLLNTKDKLVAFQSRVPPPITHAGLLASHLLLLAHWDSLLRPGGPSRQGWAQKRGAVHCLPGPLWGGSPGFRWSLRWRHRLDVQRGPSPAVERCFSSGRAE